MTIATYGTKVPAITTTLGMRMAAARRDAGISQERLAHLLGTSTRTVTRWESNERQPTIPVLISLSVLTDINLGWIMTGEVDRLSDEYKALLDEDVRPEGFEPPTFCFGARHDYSLAA